MFGDKNPITPDKAPDGFNAHLVKLFIQLENKPLAKVDTLLRV